MPSNPGSGSTPPINDPNETEEQRREREDRERRERVERGEQPTQLPADQQTQDVNYQNTATGGIEAPPTP